MKNTVKLFWIIALMAVIGLSMAGCGDMMDESAQSTSGRLTINGLNTGLNSYSGYTMRLGGSDADNEAKKLWLKSKNSPAAANDGDEVNITGDFVTVYVWKPWIRDKGNLWKCYSSNDQNVKFTPNLQQGENNVNGYVIANFSNGQATANFVLDND